MDDQRQQQISVTPVDRLSVRLRRAVRTGVGLALLPIDLAAYHARRDRPSPVFVVGCGNSGTSIVRVILGNHSKVHATVVETGFMLRDSRFSTALLRRRSIRAALELSNEAAAAGADFWLEKTPRHVHSINLLLRFDSRSRVVFVSRDAVDVVGSFLRRGYTFDRALNRWFDDNSAAIAHLHRSDRVFPLRYESLITVPHETLARLCAFLDLDFQPSMLDYADVPQALEVPDSSTRPDMAAHWRRRAEQINSPLEDRRGSGLEQLTDTEADTVIARTSELAHELENFFTEPS